MEEIKYNKDGSIAKKRGRPKKVLMPQEIEKLVSDIEKSQHEEFVAVLQEEKNIRKGDWDVKKDDPVSFFDSSLSYEATGYKPITETLSLDFDPSWFTEARDSFLRTKHYTAYRRGTKAYADFWDEEYRRCMNGLTVNGYTITGNHYFFLNYYLLPNPETDKAGTSRANIFPKFLVYLYEFFHYYELCKILKKNVCLMKSRGIGFSEINASIAANLYNSFAGSVTLLTAATDNYVKKTLSKIWNALTFINDSTDYGFFKLSLVTNTAYIKKASHYRMDNGLKIEEGWGSMIEGIVADDDSKIRGDRVDVLIFEEAGHNKNLRKSFIKGEALTTLGGNKFGVLIAGGTGGDKGIEMEGLQDMYYDPETYDILPYRHNYSPGNETVMTAFFVPVFRASYKLEYIDKRGYCDWKKVKADEDAVRAIKARNPKALIDYLAEFCYNADEAFALVGENKFNKVIIAEQLTKIKALHICPPIDTGYLNFTYKTGKPHRVEGGNILDVVWHSDKNLGKVKILEHPVWTTKYKELKEKERQEEMERTGDVIAPLDSIPMLNAMYVAGVDGIDIGQSLTSDETKDPSDFCIVIFKRVYGMLDPLIVAIYKDRPLDLREAYNTAIALAMYYNCLINIEATRMSFCNWAKSVKLLNYFMKRPRATYPDINKIKSTQYGSPATAMVINHQTDLIRDFVEDYGHTIWFEEVLNELNSYSDAAKRKFDIIAALGMAMLADEELTGINPRAVLEDNNLMQDIGYYTDERGYTRFGIIPKDPHNVKHLTYNSDYYDDDTGTVRTSNPRVFYGGIW